MKIKSALLFIALMLLGFASCTNEDIPWDLDTKFSEKLTIMNDVFISDTVDSIRIYKTHEKGFSIYGLSNLFKKKLVYETKDKDSAKRLIRAAQETIINVDNCYENRSKDTFHFVALDDTSMRAGYFVVKTCRVNEKEEYIIIQPLLTGGGSNIYFNKALLGFVQRLD